MDLTTSTRRVLRQTFLSVLIFSLLFRPMGTNAIAAEAVTASTPSQLASEENAIATDETDDTEITTNGNSVISPGFKVRLSCDDDRKLNGAYRVSADGEIALPYQVTLHAGGLKLKAFEKLLEKSYRSYFNGQPHIRVAIVQKRYAVKVTGVVKSPGTYLLKEHTTLDEALSLAGVRTEDLSSGYARVGHINHTKWVSMEDYMKGGPAHDLPMWRGGEQILFQLDRPEGEAKAAGDEEPIASPSARKITVLGEVKNPGPVSFQRHADGYYYLIQRGGPTQFSDLTKVELLRTDPKSNEHNRISLGDLQSVKDVHESDVIIVYPDRPSNFERGLAATGIVAAIVSAVMLTVFVARK